MKLCVTCHLSKDETEFDWRNIKAGIRVARCKPCQRAYGKLWYQRNRKHHAQLTRTNKQQLRADIGQLKTVPCLDCKISYAPHIMDFDHVRGKKRKNVSALVNSGNRLAVIAEIKKCDVVCANCHRDRTFKRSHGKAGSFRLPVTQEIEGSNPSGSASLIAS